MCQRTRLLLIAAVLACAGGTVGMCHAHPNDRGGLSGRNQNPVEGLRVSAQDERSLRGQPGSSSPTGEGTERNLADIPSNGAKQLRLSGIVLNDSLRPAQGIIDVELRYTTDSRPPLGRTRCGAGARFDLSVELSDAISPTSRLHLIATRLAPPAVSPPAAIDLEEPIATHALRLREGAEIVLESESATGEPLPDVEYVVLQRRVPARSRPNWRSTDGLDIIQTVRSQGIAEQLRHVVRPGDVIVRARIPGGPLGPPAYAKLHAGDVEHLGVLAVGRAWRHVQVQVVDALGRPVPEAFLRTRDPTAAMEHCDRLRHSGNHFHADEKGMIELAMPDQSSLPIEMVAAGPGHLPASTFLESLPPDDTPLLKVTMRLEARPSIRLSFVTDESPRVPVVVAPESCTLRPLSGASEPLIVYRDDSELIARFEDGLRYMDNLRCRRLMAEASHVLYSSHAGQHRIEGRMPGGVTFGMDVLLVPGQPPLEVLCALPSGRLVTLNPVRTSGAGEGFAFVRYYDLTWSPSAPSEQTTLRCRWDSQKDPSLQYWVPRGIDQVRVVPPRSLGLPGAWHDVPQDNDSCVQVELSRVPVVPVTLQLVDDRGPLALGGVPLDVYCASVPAQSTSGRTAEDGSVLLQLPPGHYQATRSAALDRPVWVPFQVELKSSSLQVLVPLR